jgi:hypothetical protein
VAGVLQTGEVVDANLRKLLITCRVECVDVRACRTTRPSILTAQLVRIFQVQKLSTGRAFRVPVPRNHVES